MPDSSLLPGWGPPPFDDRDLDAVLDGETSDIPPALRPVADALATLWAPAAAAELRGEAAAMAGFRALGLGETAGHAGPEPALLPWALPAGPPRRRRVPRHRGRRAPRLLSQRTGTAAVAAAAAVIVIVLAFTTNLPGPIQRLTGHSGRATPSAGHSASPKAGSQSPAVATAHPEVTHPAASARPEHSATCGANAQQPYPYCAPYGYGMFPHGAPVIGQHLPGPYPGTGNQENRGNSQPGSRNGPGAGFAR